VAKVIGQRELRNDNAKVIEAVTAGETFVITRNGEPVAELRPMRVGRRTLVPRAEVAALAAANVRVDRDQFRDDLDRVIDQRLAP
jgi:prevent-host-death family protein